MFRRLLETILSAYREGKESKDQSLVNDWQEW
jgi:hypothetical protein